MDVTLAEVEAQQLARTVAKEMARGCTCGYSVRSYGRLYGQDMGRGPVRVNTDKDCPVHK